MTWVIRIDTCGTVTRCQGAHLIEEARAHFRLLDLLSPPEVDVVSFRLLEDWRHPAPKPGGQIVGAVHQWSRVEGFPLNVKAWALYGRSPLCGPVFIAHDGDGVDRDPLPDWWIDEIAGDPDWIPEETYDHMRLVAAEEGAVWP